MEWGDSIYEGEWVGNIRSGRGRSIWKSDGRQYCGEWSENEFHGKGVFSFPSGHVFFGKFKKHCPTEGFLYDPGGRVFSVSYKGNSQKWNGHLPTAESINQVSNEREESKIIEDMYDAFVLKNTAIRRAQRNSGTPNYPGHDHISRHVRISAET
jgi:hypothetical protein